MSGDRDSWCAIGFATARSAIANRQSKSSKTVRLLFSNSPKPPKLGFNVFSVTNQKDL